MNIHIHLFIQGVNIRLVNWEEGNYRVTDKPKPRGEILIKVRESYLVSKTLIGQLSPIRDFHCLTNAHPVVVQGGNITAGYYKQPEKTAEEYIIDEDGERLRL